MAVESAAPPRAQLVYTLLIIAGIVAGIIGASTVGVIAYNYLTRPELRNPVQEESGGEAHATLPDWVIRV